MEHITTYLGEDFTPLAPNVNQIHIEDIAHALSLMCRANGHFTRFYSVAQHCINCANEAKARKLPMRIQIACLLHDASEAYLSDITRPVKVHLAEYRKIEKHLQDMIYQKFLGSPLTDDEAVCVEQIDHDMLICEFKELMNKRVFGDSPNLISSPSFPECDYQSVKNMFLRLASYLENGDKSITALGIDSCRGGWCVVKLDSLGNSSLHLINNIERVINMPYDIAIIDIPIGYPDSKEPRAFDKLARSLLGKRASSVFSTPCREAVHYKDYKAEDSYQKISKINESITKKKLTKQSWALIPKILEVDLFLSKNPGALMESHPELCFTILRNGKPCEYHKRTREGANERLTVLREHMDIFNLVHNPPYSENGVDVAQDDVIDAAVLALTGLNAMQGINQHIINDQTPIIDFTASEHNISD